jgi:hypothetical protein
MRGRCDEEPCEGEKIIVHNGQRVCSMAKSTAKKWGFMPFARRVAAKMKRLQRQSRSRVENGTGLKTDGWLKFAYTCN